MPAGMDKAEKSYIFMKTRGFPNWADDKGSNCPGERGKGGGIS